MLLLVVRTPFDTYGVGSIITDPNTIDAIRASENAHQVVVVSDEPVPEPPPPPPLPNFAALQAAYLEQRALIEAQQTAILSAMAVNSNQTEALTFQSEQLAQLNAALLALEAKVNAQPGTGTPIPPNLADDVPLAEDDDVVLSTDDDTILVGDIR